MTRKQKPSTLQKVRVKLRNFMTRHKIFTWIIVIIGIPVLLVLINLLGDKIQTQNAYSLVETARQESLITSDEHFEEQKKLIYNLGGDTKSVMLSKKDICFIAHNDAGWTVTDYYQECYIRYVQLYSTDLSRDSVVQKLSSYTERQKLSSETLVESLFGRLENNQNISPDVVHCSVYNDYRSPSLTYIPAGLDITKYKYAWDCETPNLVDNPGPAYAQSQLSVKSYSDIDQSKIDMSKNQLWIMYTTKYYKEALGCGAGLLFCENPRATPAHPDI